MGANPIVRAVIKHCLIPSAVHFIQEDGSSSRTKCGSSSRAKCWSSSTCTAALSCYCICKLSNKASSYLSKHALRIVPNDRLTSSKYSKLSAHHPCISVIPVIITHCPPTSSLTDLHSSFILIPATHQSYARVVTSWDEGFSIVSMHAVQ